MNKFQGLIEGKIQNRILDLLARFEGQYVPFWTLHDTVYGELARPGALRVNIHLLRKKLRPFGYVIETEWNAGYALKRAGVVRDWLFVGSPQRDYRYSQKRARRLVPKAPRSAD